MHYRIVHRGVPIGDVDLDLTQDPAAGFVNPLAGYGALRDGVRTATRALRAVGPATPTADAADPPADPAALAAGAALGRELELRDGENALVKTDFIELADWEGDRLDVTVWVRARGAFAGSPSKRQPTPRNAPGRSVPEA